MGFNREYHHVHGWINLDKPAGFSSFQAVRRVKRALFAKKVGHGGTLDPLATGVLPIALGEATKTTSYAMNGKKKYHFGIRWGVRRTTDDREGKVMETCDHRPSETDIIKATDAFLGKIEQFPPQFSAIKVDGRRAYDLARSNQFVALKPRRVHIESFNLTDLNCRDRASFSVICGKGTYVRSLARDLAQFLGTLGHVDWLRRAAVGPFQEKSSISLDKIESLGHIAARSNFLMPIETVLADIPALNLTAREAQKLKHGQSIPIMPVVIRSSIGDIKPGDTVCAMSEGMCIALARIDDGGIVPVRVMNF